MYFIISILSGVSMAWHAQILEVGLAGALNCITSKKLLLNISYSIDIIVLYHLWLQLLKLQNKNECHRYTKLN